MGKTRDENVNRLYLKDVASDPVEVGEITNNAGVLQAQDTVGVFNLRGDGQVIFRVRKTSAGTISKGSPVYITSWNVGGWLEVEAAQADAAGTMPAIGLAGEDITNSALANVVALGTVENLDTSGFSVGDNLYVDAAAPGVLVNVKPQGTNLIQKVAICARSNITVGAVEVFGAGRTNDLPNLAQDYVWLGDSNGVPSQVLASSLPAGVDTTAIHKATAAEISALTLKAAPVAADYVLIEDSAAADAKKYATLGTLPVKAHATTHKSGGSDPIKLDELAAPTDITTLNATTALHGLLPKLGGGTTNFLRADGTWAAPGGGSSPLTTKGDVYTFSTVDARLPVGTDGQVLKADSAETTGLKWATAGSGSVSQLCSFGPNDALYAASGPAAKARNGHPLINFDPSTAEYVTFHGVMSRDYSAGNVIVDIDWIAETATSGAVVWSVEWERMNAGGTDLDADSFATQQTGTTTTSGTSGIVNRTTITLTQAQADSIAAGDSFRLRLGRVAASGSDTMANDAQLLRVNVRQ